MHLSFNKTNSNESYFLVSASDKTNSYIYLITYFSQNNKLDSEIIINFKETIKNFDKNKETPSYNEIDLLEVICSNNITNPEDSGNEKDQVISDDSSQKNLNLFLIANAFNYKEKEFNMLVFQGEFIFNSKSTKKLEFKLLEFFNALSNPSNIR